MKIGIITEHYYPSLGGISEHVHNTYLQFKQRGFEVKIITPRTPGNKHLFNTWAAGEDIIHIRRSIPLYTNGGFSRSIIPFGLKGHLRKLFEKEQFDLIHIHSPFGSFLGLASLRVANCPTVCTYHSVYKNCTTYRLFKKLGDFFMRSMDLRIGISPQCIDSVKQYFDFNFKMIPNGIDATLFHPDLPKIDKFNDDVLNIMFLGRFDPNNGLGYLINAFHNVKKRFKKCRLIIVGDGPLAKKYHKMAERNKDDIHFVGLQHKLKANYLATADIFCHPAVMHAQSIVTLEAMASGLPIVASNLDSFKWCMSDAATYFESKNEDALVDALLKMLRDPELRIDYAAKARRRALDYSWDKIANKLIEEFNHILGINSTSESCDESPFKQRPNIQSDTKEVNLNA
jgi:phosphatidylinositol alpha-mannosyltransferase